RGGVHDLVDGIGPEGAGTGEYVPIAAGDAAQDVGAAPAREDVVPAAAVEDVVAVGAAEVVGLRAAGDALDLAGQHQGGGRGDDLLGGVVEVDAGGEAEGAEVERVRSLAGPVGDVIGPERGGGADVRGG